MTSALEAWRRELEARAIPQRILDAAPVSPWGFPRELFRRRAERAISRSTPTSDRAAEALPDGGTVLDVGCGSGATSVWLAGRASRVIGVDTSADLLESFRRTIAAAGARAEAIEGGWPDVAAAAPVTDVAVCGHVVYNVQDLGPFVDALTEHVRARVVVELTDRHPLAWINDLWERFHGVRFPAGPTADVAVEALRELDIGVQRQDRVDDDRGRAGFDRREDAIELVRTRLCLTESHDPEIADALAERLREHDGGWSAGPQAQTIVTLWWDGRG